jgi:VanZ family protein
VLSKGYTLSKRDLFCLGMALVYSLLVAVVLLTPDPWALLGWAGKRLEGSVDATLADYVQHGVAYALLLMLWTTALTWARPWTMPGSLAIALLHGTVFEVAQWWIPQRTFDLRDLAANWLGVLLAWLFCHTVGHIAAVNKVVLP